MSDTISHSRQMMTFGLDRWKSHGITDDDANAIVAELRAIGRAPAIELADESRPPSKDKHQSTST